MKSPGSVTSSSSGDLYDDDLRLQQLGYHPVFKRTFRKFTNAAVTISAMSVLLSVTASFGTGLTYGGPAVIVWGWIGVSLCCICVAAGMSELASAYPSSGGMYFWVYQLLGPTTGPFVCWVTGWLNLLGQISSLASTMYFTVSVLETFVLLSTGTAQPAHDADYGATGPGKTFTPSQTLGIYAGMLALCATINSFGGKWLVYITEFGAFFHIVGMLILIIAVPCIATQHQSAKWVFTKFESDLGKDANIPNNFYIAILGFLLPAYAYTGYDGPAHMAEESRNAVWANSQGIMAGMYFMAVSGFAWIISLLFSISDRLYVLGEGDVTPEADGDVIPQILWDAFKQRRGDGIGSLGLLIIPLLGVFFCGISTMTYIARILFCYSRDRAVPLSWLWVKLAPNKVPVVAVWGVALAAFIIATPSVRNDLAFNAILSLSTIALNIAYVAPSFIRITFGRKNFKPGPWSLGKWAYPINIIATLWVGFAVVIFSLPTEYPVDANKNLNYAGVTLLGTFFLSCVWFWFPYIGAYRWFKGPVREITISDDGSKQDIGGSKEDLRYTPSTTQSPIVGM